MKRFKVFWTQHHEARVEAKDKYQAKTLAIYSDEVDTFSSIEGVVAVEVSK